MSLFNDLLNSIRKTVAPKNEIQTQLLEVGTLKVLHLDLIYEIIKHLSDEDGANLALTCKGLLLLTKTTHSIWKGFPLEHLWNDQDIRKAVDEVVESLDKRPLNANEANSVGIHNRSYNYPMQQVIDIEETLNSEQKIRELCDAFDKYSHANPFKAMHLVLKLIGKSNPNNSIDIDSSIFKLKMKSCITEVSQHVFKNMVDSFANLPAKSITPDNYIETAKQIKVCFPDITIVDIEAALRQALLAKHDKAFKKLSDEFLILGTANKKVVEIEKDLKLKLEAEQKDLDKQDKEFHGTNGFNGTVNTAFQATVTPKADLETAIAKFQIELRKQYGVNPILPIEKVSANESKELKDARADFKVKYAAWDALNKFYVEIDKKAKDVAIKLAEVNSKLEPINLSNLAINKTVKIGRFYGELDKTVRPSQSEKESRYNSMHQIIG